MSLVVAVIAVLSVTITGIRQIHLARWADRAWWCLPPHSVLDNGLIACAWWHRGTTVVVVILLLLEVCNLGCEEGGLRRSTIHWLGRSGARSSSHAVRIVVGM